MADQDQDTSIIVEKKGKKRSKNIHDQKKKITKKRRQTYHYDKDEMHQKQSLLEKKLAKMSPKQMIKIKGMVERGLLDEETLYEALTQEPPYPKKKKQGNDIGKKVRVNVDGQEVDAKKLQLSKKMSVKKEADDDDDDEEEWDDVHDDDDDDNETSLPVKQQKGEHDDDDDDDDDELDASSMGLTPVELVLLQQQAQQNEMMENFRKSQDQLAEYNDMIASFFLPPDKRAEAAMTEADKKKTANQKEAFRLKYFSILQDELKKKKEEENLKRQAALVYDMMKKEGKSGGHTSSTSRSARSGKSKRNANAPSPPSIEGDDGTDNISDDDLATNPTLQKLLANF